MHAGECEKNAAYMVGDYFTLGQCRLSCGSCEVCALGDRGCRNRNRERGGFLVTTASEELAQWGAYNLAE